MQLFDVPLDPPQIFFYYEIHLMSFSFLLLFLLFVVSILRDVTVSFSGKKFRAHKVILSARSKKWCTGDLSDQDEIELEGTYIYLYL